MAESIAELREKCQKGRVVKGRRGEHWIARRLYRRVSIYFTKEFLALGLSANQVSVLSLAVSVIAAVMFASGEFAYSAAAGILVFVAQATDYSDGEVARYRKTAGEKGERVEYVLGHLDIPLYFIGAGLGAMKVTGRVEFAAMGAVCAVLIMKKQHNDEIAKTYSKKIFHTDAKDSFKRVFSSWKTTLVFLAFSQYLLLFVFMATGFFFVQQFTVLAWFFLTMGGYIVHSRDFVEDKSSMAKTL